MPYDPNKNLVYIHIPKCAGTYIETLLRLKNKYLYSDRDILPFCRTYQHYTINMILNNKLIDNIQSKYIFCTVRNPYHRFLSAYHQYPENCSEAFKTMINGMSYTDFAKHLFDKINNEGYDFFQYGTYHQFQPMYDYISSDIPLNIQIVKMEDDISFKETLKEICSKCNYEYVDTKMNAANTYIEYDKILNENNDLKKYLQIVYKKDFEFFNYNV